MPLKSKLSIVLFSQDVDNKLEAPCVLNNLCKYVCCENKYYKKPTSKLYSILDLHDAQSTEMQEPVVIEGNRLIPSH